MMKRWICVLTVLLLFRGLVALSADPKLPGPFSKPPALPDRVVALAFIGSGENYATLVAPLLRQFDFGATFYVDDVDQAPAGTMLDQVRPLRWPQIKELSSLGFEIGNATASAREAIIQLPKAKLVERVEFIERRCAENGVPKPVTFCYPDGTPCLLALQVLADRGYSLATEYRTGLTYEPARDHPLLVPGEWFYGHSRDRDRFHEVIENWSPGKFPVLIFDGIETGRGGTRKEQFKEYLRYLADRQFTVVSVRDLAAVVNAGAALRAARTWRRDGNEFLRQALTRKVQATPPVAVTPLQKHLEALLLPKVDWHEASLGSVLKAFREQVSSQSGGQVQPGLSLDPGLDLTTPVTLRLTDTPAMEILRYLSDLARTDFVVDQYAISARSRTASSPRTTVKTPVPNGQRSRLESLIIPEVNFEDIPLRTAVEVLRQKAVTASKDGPIPNFVIEAEPEDTMPVTLRLANVPFMEVLRYLGDLAQVDGALDRYAISLRPRIDARQRITPKTPADRPQMQMWESLVIPEVVFKEASLGSALGYLRHKAMASSGGRMQPRFVIDPELDLSTPVTLSLANTPFTEVLRYAGDLAEVEFTVEKYGISVWRRQATAVAAAREPFVLVK